MITLTAENRSETGKASRALLENGKMPAVVYGPKQETIAISVPLREFTKILRDEGESSVIELSGVTAKPLQVLIHDMYRDPVTTLPHHADFYAIEKGAKVEVEVPLSYVGESPAVKAGANLVKVLHEVTVEADATHLPHEVEVDISKLATTGDQIHVSDLTLPTGVAMITEGEEVVALIQEVQIEEETTEAAPDMSAIEVEQKGKAEDAEEAE